MNKRVKKLWIEALRGGEFEPAYNELRGLGQTRCCLGVLCEVFRRNTNRGRWRRNLGDWFFHADGNSSNATLPDAVVKWAKLPNDNPNLGSISTTARLNDDRKGFEYIADQIERHL